MTSAPSVIASRDAGVVTLVLNQPARKNAIDVAGFRALRSELASVASSPDDRVVILTGAGEDFSSGADLRDAERDGMHDLLYMRLVADAVTALHRLPVPTIAKVRGVAAGIGCNLALGCDLVVAGDDARFCEVFVRRGLSIDGGGSWLLPKILGPHRAKELALFGDEVSAPEAARLGLVNRVVPVDELDGAVGDWAGRLATGPPLALSTTKRLIDAGLTSSFEQAVEAETHAQVVNLARGDAWEAVLAFRDGRDPEFRGYTRRE